MAAGPDNVSQPRASHEHTSVEGTLEFLKRTRAELRSLRKVRVWKDRFQVIDVNKDYFEIRGVGYEHDDIVPLLRNLNTAFDPQRIREAIAAEYKEYDTGRRHPWAEDRVM